MKIEKKINSTLSNRHHKVDVFARANMGIDVSNHGRHAMYDGACVTSIEGSNLI